MEQCSVVGLALPQLLLVPPARRDITSESATIRLPAELKIVDGKFHRKDFPALGAMAGFSQHQLVLLEAFPTLRPALFGEIRVEVMHRQ